MSTIYKGDDTVRLNGESVDRNLSGVAAVYIKLNGGSQVIGQSLNVSSVTDQSIGEYATNLTNSMSDTEYEGNTAQSDGHALYSNNTTPTVSSFNTDYGNATFGVYLDPTIVTSSVHGDLA